MGSANSDLSSTASRGGAHSTHEPARRLSPCVNLSHGRNTRVNRHLAQPIADAADFSDHQPLLRTFAAASRTP